MASPSSALTDMEVEVHNWLRSFLRSQSDSFGVSSGEPVWPHHLTMGRLVARGLRLGRSALIQTGSFAESDGRYRLSYLIPLLMSPNPALLLVPESLHRNLLEVEIPKLQAWGNFGKSVAAGDRFETGFNGLLLVSPLVWLADRLGGGDRFPAGIPTIFDGADDLERWTRELLTVKLGSGDWESLMQTFPDRSDAIRDVRVNLTKTAFQHPANPYDCYLLDATEQKILQKFYSILRDSSNFPQLPLSWSEFWDCFDGDNALTWVELDRAGGKFVLYACPANVASILHPVWQQQPIVLIGGALDLDAKATIYRQRVGLPDLTCIKFLPDRQNESIHLYLPDRLPLPNTPQFQEALIRELHTLIRVSTLSAPVVRSLTVILVGDTPLKAIVGSVLAAQFGSRVRVEQTELADNGILVAGWEFWRQYQGQLPPPRLLAIATLPLPSLENPRVAGQVAYYKQQRQDWFRLYLLPMALAQLQRAIAPVRTDRGVVALLDTRVIHRSYGSAILEAIAPMVRINYVDASLFAMGWD
ncbi:MAG: helicase C-terminal domain-containing protein [Geitlerinemataceae cyanobacterium]